MNNVANRFSLDSDSKHQTNNILMMHKDMAMDGVGQIISNFSTLQFPASGILSSNEYSFFRVNQLSYDQDYPKREAMENVLLSIDNEAYNFVYILTGTSHGVDLCMGVVRNGNEYNGILNTKLSANNYCENLAKAFEGNFNGSKLTKIRGEELKDLAIYSANKYHYAGIVRGVPSIDEKDVGAEEGFQGIDRLINSMLGEEWRVAIICEPVKKSKIIDLKSDVYDFYNRMSVWAKSNIQHSENQGTSLTKGKNISDTKGKNIGTSNTKGASNTEGSDGFSTGKNSTKGTSKGVSESHTSGISDSETLNKGNSQAITIEKANKAVQEMMSFIDEELLKRLKIGSSKRMFNTSVIYMADNPANANRLKVSLMSLFQGKNPSYSPLHANDIDMDDDDNKKTLNVYQNRTMYMPEMNTDIMTLLSRPFEGAEVGIGTYLTAREVSLLAGLPQKEVPGITLKESIGYGLNAKPIDDQDAINMGYVMQKGRILEDIPFKLNNSILNKHVFIAGVTGSGKTTTCHRLLYEINKGGKGKRIPFMVIEPAKTEYRTLVRNHGEFGDVAVFTLGRESSAPFRLNPFELVEGELISSHVDMLKAAFTSAFPMEASMPQLLEEAIYNCYEAMGWDIETNEYLLTAENGNPFENRDIDAFPQLSDLLQALREVVEIKGFGSELKQNYVGSLVSRLSNLVIGSKGLMLNCPRSVDFSYIAHNNVILELEEIKSGEEKAFIMGLILGRMAAVIKGEHKKNNKYRHVTLVEEAHRLLSKMEYGDSGAKKNAVESFTDLLAEVRKYGEGLIIADQIPNKLTSDILKNTNTKIIHRILARDDKESVGDTMLMNDKQKEYLSALDVGDAVIFTESTANPVNVHINPFTDTNEEQVDEDEVQKNFNLIKSQLGVCYNHSINAACIRKYRDFVEQLVKILVKPQAREESQKAEQEKLRLAKEKYELLIKILGKSSPKQWEELIQRGDIVLGRRFKEMYQNAVKYQQDVVILANFFATRFENTTIEELSEFRQKYNILPHRKI